MIIRTLTVLQLACTSLSAFAAGPFYPNWGGTTATCLDAQLPENTPEDYMVSQGLMREDVEQCCDDYYWYSKEGCLAAAGVTSDETDANDGTKQYYVDYTNGRYVREKATGEGMGIPPSIQINRLTLIIRPAQVHAGLPGNSVRRRYLRGYSRFRQHRSVRNRGRMLHQEVTLHGPISLRVKERGRPRWDVQAVSRRQKWNLR